MDAPPPTSDYSDLVDQMRPADSPARTSEDDLDGLITALETRKRRAVDQSVDKEDRIELLRKAMFTDYIPVFVEVMEKYSPVGLGMEMDASKFLEGGRELRFEFGIEDFRAQLLGTVTTEAIAFHETRFSPDVRGELVSGPMLRLHTLTPDVFRQFLCERLSVLLRDYMRQRRM